MASIDGTTSGDILSGGSASYEIYGTEGDDFLFGGVGSDRIYGGLGNDIIRGNGGKDKLFGGSGSDTIIGRAGGFFGGGGNDLIIAKAQTGIGQIHVFGMEGNDHLRLDFREVDDEVGYDQSLSFGHHVRADVAQKQDDNDIFEFTNFDHIQGLVVGRLEDFDASRDQIQIDGKILEFKNGQPAQNFGTSTSVTIVEFAGDYHANLDKPVEDMQQWLLIETNSGGEIAYALEGARVMLPGLGSSNSGNQESHFVSGIGSFESLPSTAFRIAQNNVPQGYEVQGGIVINDTDLVYADTIVSVVGTERGDLIAGGLNDDLVFGNGGNDMIWGGSGHDVIHGEDGNDTLFGGSGNDRYFGGGGADWMTTNGNGTEIFNGGAGKYDTVSYADVVVDNAIVTLLLGIGTGGIALGDTFEDVENITGSSQNDVLHGDNQKNYIRGLYGNDFLKGNGGNDRFNGGGGDDFIDGGSNYDYAIFEGVSSDFLIWRTVDTIFTKDVRAEDGNEGSDQLTSVEVLVFANETILASDII